MTERLGPKRNHGETRKAVKFPWETGDNNLWNAIKKKRLIGEITAGLLGDKKLLKKLKGKPGKAGPQGEPGASTREAEIFAQDAKFASEIATRATEMTLRISTSAVMELGEEVRFAKLKADEAEASAEKAKKAETQSGRDANMATASALRSDLAEAGSRLHDEQSNDARKEAQAASKDSEVSADRADKSADSAKQSSEKAEDAATRAKEAMNSSIDNAATTKANTSVALNAVNVAGILLDDVLDSTRQAENILTKTEKVAANVDAAEKRIEKIAATPGQQGVPGEIGPAGPQGLRGADGPVGPAGPQGINGKSIFELAKAGGFEGNEQDWLNSLQGAKGEKGSWVPGAVIAGILGTIAIIAAGAFDHKPVVAPAPIVVPNQTQNITIPQQITIKIVN